MDRRKDRRRMRIRAVSPFHAPGSQPLHKELLTGNEHDQNRNQAEHRQSKYIPPLGELMLPEESGDGNRKCPFQFIVDHRISPGELFPRCQKIENGNRGNPQIL